MSEDPALDELLDVLSDEYARDILAATSIRPMSAHELADACEMSKPTVYRRVERLQAADLLAEQTKVEPDANNYSVYRATLSAVAIELDTGEFDADVTHTDEPAFPGADEADTADRFTKMWEGL